MQKKTIGMAWLIIFVIATSMAAYAESVPKIKSISPVPKIKKISPVPKVKWIKMSEVELYGICTIDRIGKNEIVLDDDLFRLASDVTFFAESGKPLSKSRFRRGNKIGFTMNGKEIISIWKIK